MKILINIITILILFITMPISNASDTKDESNKETMLEQQEEFGVGEFIDSAKEYTNDFFDENELNDFFNSAIKGEVDNSSIFKKILSLLGQEFVDSIKAVGSILVIIVIHSILKAISESLENESISKLIYYVQYILIVTIIMSSFSGIVKLVQDTTNNLVGFMNLLVPLLIALMLYTGSIATSGVLEPIILFMINFIGNIIQTIIIPGVLIFAGLVVISKISNNFQIGKLSKFFQSSIIWFLGIVLTIFVGVVSLEGTLSSSVDGITAKTTKAVVSTAIPVVGKILGDAVDTVLGCGIILKNAVGLIGVIVVIAICIAPILKLAILTITYKLLAGICEPIADKNIVSLIEQVGDIFKIFLAILTTISVLLIIGTALVVKISNTGMMYR
ncbi:MAG: stage III sporulation protein AE [Clostridia bacterium]|nr:stage III sporulation protein AE [Clostridium sp.]MBS6252034.1 stage III sporulation protein AE [Clostridium sp.]